MVLAARSSAKLEEMASGMREQGAEAFAVEIDLADIGSIAAGVTKAVKEFGRIDILVNNAGITKDGLAVRMKKADWDIVLQTNLSGAFHAIQQVLPGMMRERWGRIINISSVVGEMGNAGPGKLRGLESRLDRLDEVARAGGGKPEYHRECGSAWICWDGHDAWADRGIKTEVD